MAGLKRSIPLTWLIFYGLGNILGAGIYVLYGMARQGWAPSLLAGVSGRTQTPVVATLLVIIMVMLFAFWLPLVALAKITSFIVLVIFCLIWLAALLTRFGRPVSGVFYRHAPCGAANW